MSEKMLKITLCKSVIGSHAKRRATVKALGLKRLRQTVVRPDNPSIRGMLAVVADMVKVEPVAEA